jgi:regulator of protease activity HflC (stomatin/prohibitin superfamily)
MAIKAVLGFLIAVFSIGILAGIALAVINTQRGRRSQPGTMIAIIGAVGVLIIAPLNAGLVLVEPNEVGVVFRQTASGDAALQEPLQTGLSWVLPFVDQVIVYDVSQQSITMAGGSGGEYNQTQVGTEGTYSAVRATSSDGQVVYVDATVIIRLDAAQINNIHRNWRGTYIEGFIIPQVRSEIRNLVSTYGAEEIYSGGRAELETQVADALREPLQHEGFILFDVLIRNIEFSTQFTEAIEQKQIAEQEAQRAAFRVQQAAQEAEKARVDAQGRADSVVIEAQGDAEATVIRAQAESEALDLINQIIAQNPDLIQWQYINELGEDVRVIIVPSNSPYLFDLESMIGAAGGEAVSTPVPTPMPEIEEEPVE